MSAKEWPTWEDATSAPCGFGVRRNDARAAVGLILSREQYDLARRAIARQADMLAALEAIVEGKGIAGIHVDLADALIMGKEALSRARGAR